MRLLSRSFLLLLLIGLTAIPGLPVVWAESSAEPSLPSAAPFSSTAICSDQHTVTFSPGITLSSGSYTFSTKPGPMTCVGQVKGQAITGPGALAQNGVAEGDCSHGSLAGTLFLSIPTAAGVTNLSIPYKGTYAPGVGLKSADHMSAIFEFYPTRGDCISAPLAEIGALQQTVVTT
jgi:hypothetical protein